MWMLLASCALAVWVWFDSKSRCGILGRLFWTFVFPIGWPVFRFILPKMPEKDLPVCGSCGKAAVLGGVCGKCGAVTTQGRSDSPY